MTLLTKAFFLYMIGFAFILPYPGSADLSAAESSDNFLSFNQAWEWVQKNNPALAAARSHIEASESATLKAGTRPNPVLSVEAENFGGSGSYSGSDALETTLLLQQTRETGGKRQARTSEARAETEFSRAEAEDCRLELWLTLVTRYAEALQAGEQEVIAMDNARLAKELYLLVSQRVQAGKSTYLEAARAEVEAELAGIEHNSARRQTQLARRRLAMLWGNSNPAFTALRGHLDSVQEWRLSPTSTGATNSAPTLIKAQQEHRLRQAALKREEALAHPDIVFSGGLRRFEGTEEVALIGGLTVPLPLFDRNRAGIQQAQHELSRADQLQQAAMLQQELDQETLTVAAENAWNEIVLLRDKILPAAREAMEKARAGYEQGKFSYLEWIEAQRSFTGLRTRWIATLTDYHKTLAEWGRLTGKTAELSFFNLP